MLRQPLRDTGTNAGRMRSNRVEDVAKKPRSQSVLKTSSRRSITGIENQQATSVVAKKRTPTKSKSESSKSRKKGVKVLLGGMFDRFQRTSSNSSSSRSSSTSSASLRVEALDATKHDQDHQQQLQQKPGVHDISQTTVLTEMESSSPILDESFDVDVQLLEEEETASPEQQKEELATILKEKERVGATLLQSLFRGYSQRYEFKMLVLRKKLQQIEYNKERQLASIENRTITKKRQTKSVFDFQDPHEKTGRQLQRVARIIPYLFREAQSKIRENAQLAQTPQQLQELQESHMNLQKLAHAYLESLEDLPGIWEALKAQWMGPKRGRVRRTFGPDGNIIKTVAILKQYNNDNDLPIENARALSRAPSVVPDEHTAYVNLFVQAYASEIYTTDKDVDQSVEQFQEAVGKHAWN